MDNLDRLLEELFGYVDEGIVSPERLQSLKKEIQELIEKGEKCSQIHDKEFTNYISKENKALTEQVKELKDYEIMSVKQHQSTLDQRDALDKQCRKYETVIFILKKQVKQLEQQLRDKQ